MTPKEIANALAPHWTGRVTNVEVAEDMLGWSVRVTVKPPGRARQVTWSETGDTRDAAVEEAIAAGATAWPEIHGMLRTDIRGQLASCQRIDDEQHAVLWDIIKTDSPSFVQADGTEGHHIHKFADRATAARWLSRSRSPAGMVLSIAEAEDAMLVALNNASTLEYERTGM